MTNGHSNGNGYTNGHANGHGGRNVLDSLARIGSHDATRSILPHNHEAEEGVVGAMLLDNEVIPVVRALATGRDFYDERLATLYREILLLADTGSGVDSITLEEHLRARGQLAKAGGFDAIIGAMKSVPHPANARYYAQIVREKAQARAILEAIAEVERKVYLGNATSEDLRKLAIAKLGPDPDASLHSDALDPDRDEPASTRKDVRRAVGAETWLWPGWIIDSHMTVLAAEPGTGKTRLTLDLCRRLWFGIPWPCGAMVTRPRGTPSLWIASDRNHREIDKFAGELGLPDEALYFNSHPSDPTGDLKLDEPEALARLDRRVKTYKPGLIVIDTVNKATRLPLYRPEDAERFFAPILEIAMRRGVPVLALTHLSKSGDPLDRRIEGTCRVMWKLTKPEGDETTNRRRLQVVKSSGVNPAPLGVVMGDTGNEYDGAPPVIAAAPANRPPVAVLKAMDWLKAYLADGPVYCAKVFDDSASAGIKKNTFYTARTALGVITEGETPNKQYRLPAPGETPSAPTGDDSGEVEDTDECEAPIF